MTYRGVYDSATQYEQLDVVRYQSAAYLALTDVIGEAPGTSAKWGLIAQDGVYSAVAGNGISLSGNTISLDSTVVNNLIATYLASVKAQTISAQSTHDQIPTAKAVYDYAVSSAVWSAQYADLIRTLNGKPSTADVQSMIEDYAASKASYTYLNNQYTQLANDVAQLPTTADVQQMIDDSIGGVLSGEY